MVSPEEQLLAEAELARQLKEADPSSRGRLYGNVYDRIYEMHLGRDRAQLEFGARPAMADFIAAHTRPGDAVLEVGCGAGMLALELAARDREVTGVDVSAVILAAAQRRAAGRSRVNFRRVEGVQLPFPDGEFDFAFSVEVFEHLHEDDARQHLREIHRVLRAGGSYWCLTPNRLDRVSNADRFGVATEVEGDVHLKEWTYGELDAALREAGFRTLRSPWRTERLLRMPWLPARVFEVAEKAGPLLRRRRIRSLLGLIACSVVATKA